jgi:hypothetical protein
MTASTKTADFAAEWRIARLIYPIYAALAREFMIDTPRCPELESNEDAPTREAVEQGREWLRQMDERIEVHQLRQFLLTTTLSSENTLRALLQHYAGGVAHTAADRDKLDFVLVQFFSHCAPSRLDDDDVDLAYVAQTLEPVLGHVTLAVPPWLEPIDGVLQSARRCSTLNDLLNNRILETGRKLKNQAGDSYFLPIAMIVFTHFSFLMRRIFFRLMQDDLNTIMDGLSELERRGRHVIDCRQAQFSAQESTSRLRMICQSWKVMFHAEYSSGQPLRMLVDLRAAVDKAMADTVKPGQAAPAEPSSLPGRAMAAAAPSRSAADFAASAKPDDWGGALDDDGAM